MADTNITDPVLAQLVRLTQLLESLNARLETLERITPGVGVGESSRSEDSPPRNDPGTRELPDRSQSTEQTRDDNARSSQQHLVISPLACLREQFH